MKLAATLAFVFPLCVANAFAVEWKPTEYTWYVEVESGLEFGIFSPDFSDEYTVHGGKITATANVGRKFCSAEVSKFDSARGLSRIGLNKLTRQWFSKLSPELKSGFEVIDLKSSYAKDEKEKLAIQKSSSGAVHYTEDFIIERVTFVPGFMLKTTCGCKAAFCNENYSDVDVVILIDNVVDIRKYKR